MGKTLLGGVSQEGSVELLSPEQRNFLSSVLGGQSQQAGQAYGDFLQQYNPEQFQSLYQKSFIEPAQQALQRQIIPGIKENFMGLDESASSALNRALAQSATDVSTSLGQGMLGQYNQMGANRLNALSGLGGMAGAKGFEPLINQQQGLLGPILQGLGTAAGMYASSMAYKENIRPLTVGLKALKNMQAYQYDYKAEMGGQKHQTGLIAEECPKEVVDNVEGLTVVNVYAMVAVLVNCIKELEAKIEALKKE